MKVVEHVNYVLEKIIFEGSNFNLAIKSSINNDKRGIDSETLNAVTSVCGSYLRHYYSLSESVKRRFPDLDEKIQLQIGVVLSDKLFSKKLDREEALKIVLKNHPDREKDINEYLDSVDEPFKLMPEEVKPESDEYNHLRYNLPLFLVKMWRRNCKNALSRKLFKSFKKNNRHIVRIDTNKISVEEFFNKYPEFTRVDEYPLAVINDTKNPKRLPCVMNGEALNMHVGFTYALEGLDVDFLRGVAIYGAANNEILDELYARYGSNIKLEYLCGAQRHFFEVNNKIKRYHLKNLSVYECGYDALRTCISKPVHTFIVCPENTSFQRMKEESDYFLRINPDDLDSLIANELTALENAADLIEEGGYLAYIVPTLCRNETYGLIHKFIEEHEEFSLEKEIQLFPFDKFNSMIYFAVLKKEINND